MCGDTFLHLPNRRVCNGGLNLPFLQIVLRNLFAMEALLERRRISEKAGTQISVFLRHPDLLKRLPLQSSERCGGSPQITRMDGAIPADFEHVPWRCACEFRPFRSGDGRIHCSRLAVSIEPLPEAGFRSNWTEKHGEAEVESILPGHPLCFQEHAIALFG